jgi:PH (Pleckstrin Homology) domain-containing protein/uncharacterized protein DUF4286
VTTPATFRLAPMSSGIRLLTVAVLVIPIVLYAVAAATTRLFLVPALAVAATYAWVWLWLRPLRFVVYPDRLEVVWPTRWREIPRDEITAVRLTDGDRLRAETGWRVRVGAGGLGGAFGWLWTERRGIVRLYVSRTDGLVWIERRDGWPWLISPCDPEAFVHALSPRQPPTPLPSGGSPVPAALFTVKATITPDREQAFNEWYHREHIPDVLKFPGVVRARRYRATQPEDRFQYVTVYEFESEAALDRFLASQHLAFLRREYDTHFGGVSDRQRACYVQVWP